MQQVFCARYCAIRMNGVVVKLDVSGVGMTSQRTRNRLTERLREQGILNESVLQVMGSTPRHLFVDEALSHRAYEDTALPIGHGQTISQPYIVARMTELLLEGSLPASVLEVGTGVGLSDCDLGTVVRSGVYCRANIGPFRPSSGSVSAFGPASDPIQIR